jgi:hypothetical protein
MKYADLESALEPRISLSTRRIIMARRYEWRVTEIKAMGKDTRTKLIAVGAEALADALLQLASTSDRAAAEVDRLLMSPEEATGGFRDRLEEIVQYVNREGFISWRPSGNFADDIFELLLSLETANPDPRTGVELVAAFFAAFESVIEACDDSSGHVSSLFRFEGTDRFVGFAKRCDDCEFVEETVLRLCSNDGYGVTEYLVQRAPEYLPEESLLRLIDRFKKAAEAESGKEERSLLLTPLEMLARRLGDPDLFVWCRRLGSTRLSPKDRIEIAEVYLDAGKAKQALEWLPEEDKVRFFDLPKREHLLMTALEQVGDVAGATEVAWTSFRRSRNDYALEKLVGFVGEDDRDRAVDEGWRAIRMASGLLISDLDFLIANGRAGNAADHLIERIAHLDTSPTHHLVPLAEGFAESGQPLAATLVYRGLLDILLEKGQPRSYKRGARHIESLRRLAAAINDWRGFPAHEEYVAVVREKHGRKWSFWKLVDEGG